MFAFFYSLFNSFSLLLGWGFDDLRGFFADYSRITMFVLHFVTFFWMGLYLTFGTVEKKPGTKVKKQDIVTFFSFIGPILYQTLGSFFERYNHIPNLVMTFSSRSIKWLGFSILVIGIIYMIWAPIYLGDFFSLNIEIQKNHRLVDGGPFTLVRHPKYFGTALYYIGMSLFYQSFILLGLNLGILLMIMWRISDEENLLQIEFEAEWEAHCKKIRWRLFPFIW
jgi:protein-S-isoprenylcysteine O-methyltransferase Ste14